MGLYFYEITHLDVPGSSWSRMSSSQRSLNTGLSSRPLGAQTRPCMHGRMRTALSAFTTPALITKTYTRNEQTLYSSPSATKNTVFDLLSNYKLSSGSKSVRSPRSGTKAYKKKRGNLYVSWSEVFLCCCLARASKIWISYFSEFAQCRLWWKMWCNQRANSYNII